MKRYGRIWNIYKYYYDNNKFDSSWELKFYIFLKDHKYNFVFHPKNKIKEYFINGKKHYYEPDFLIDDHLYEIKGSHFFNEAGQLIDIYGDKHIMLEKQKAMEDVIILTEESDFLKKAFQYFETLDININDLRGKK